MARINTVPLDNEEKAVFIGDLLDLLGMDSFIEVVKTYKSTNKTLQENLCDDSFPLWDKTFDTYNAEPIFIKGMYVWVINTRLRGKLKTNSGIIIRIHSGYIGIIAPYRTALDNLNSYYEINKTLISKVSFNNALYATLNVGVEHYDGISINRNPLNLDDICLVRLKLTLGKIFDANFIGNAHLSPNMYSLGYHDYDILRKIEHMHELIDDKGIADVSCVMYDKSSFETSLSCAGCILFGEYCDDEEEVNDDSY